MVVGSDVDVINLFARKMGFTYSIRRERHAGWYRGPNGTNDGMVYRVHFRSINSSTSYVTFKFRSPTETLTWESANWYVLHEKALKD